MTRVVFVTGNQNKIKEAQQILGNKFTVVAHNIDLPEIQSTEVEDVVQGKIMSAYAIIKKPCFIEDTGLYIENMNGFPGALIKFYFDKIKNEGIAEFNGGSRAYAKTVIAFHDGKRVHSFTGILKGSIAKKPKGIGFGWDPVFIPSGAKKTFGEMAQAEKNAVSMRRLAFEKLRRFLMKPL